MNQSILTKLEQLSMRLEEINALLSEQSVASDQNRFRELSIEHSQLSPVNDKYNEYLSTSTDIEAATKLLDEEDKDIKEMAEEEITTGQNRLDELELELKKSLLPKDPNDSRDIIIEIRAGTGGDEASIFSGDLYRMYTRYVEKSKWQIEVLSSNLGEHAKKSLQEFLVQMSIQNLNLNLEHIEFKEFLKLSHKGEFILRPVQ